MQGFSQKQMQGTEFSIPKHRTPELEGTLIKH